MTGSRLGAREADARPITNYYPLDPGPHVANHCAQGSATPALWIISSLSPAPLLLPFIAYVVCASAAQDSPAHVVLEYAQSARPGLAPRPRPESLKFWFTSSDEGRGGQGAVKNSLPWEAQVSWDGFPQKNKNRTENTMIRRQLQSARRGWTRDARQRRADPASQGYWRSSVYEIQVRVVGK